MGKANVHPTGEYEGVYYVDFENLLSYTKKDDETERKTLKNISPWEMSDYEFDDVESQMNLENYRATLVDALKKRFPSFKEPVGWYVGIPGKHILLENDLFYIAVEDNEWSEAVELLQKEENSVSGYENLQKRHYQNYIQPAPASPENKSVYTAPPHRSIPASCSKVPEYLLKILLQ